MEILLEIKTKFTGVVLTQIEKLKEEISWARDTGHYGSFMPCSVSGEETLTATLSAMSKAKGATIEYLTLSSFYSTIVETEEETIAQIKRNRQKIFKIAVKTLPKEFIGQVEVTVKLKESKNTDLNHYQTIKTIEIGEIGNIVRNKEIIPYSHDRIKKEDFFLNCPVKMEEDFFHLLKEKKYLK